MQLTLSCNIAHSMNAPAKVESSPVVYSAVLRPHRSASRATTRLIVFLMCIIWLPTGFVFFLAGAWPILPFLGAEVVLLYGALRLNQYAGNALEAINLTREALTVRRIDHWGKQRKYSFSPHWLQVNLNSVTGDNNALELRSQGRSLIIAQFLLPQERQELAEALRRELMRLTRARAAAMV